MAPRRIITGEKTRRLIKGSHHNFSAKEGRSTFLACCKELEVGQTLGNTSLTDSQLDTGTQKV